MAWTLEHDSTELSLEARGITNAILSLRSLAPSALSFSIPSHFDAAETFEYGDLVTLRDTGGVVRFVGRFRVMPKTGSGPNEARDFLCEDVLGDFARRVMLQDWQGEGGEGIPALVLFDDGAGAGRNIGLVLQEIVNAAIAYGVSVQLGDVPTVDVTPRAYDASNLTLLEALHLVSRYVPDLGTRVDYTTTPPTLHLIRRVDADEKELAAINAATTINLEPLNDQQVQGVVLIYRQAAEVEGVITNHYTADIFPEEATPQGENVISAVIPLQGSFGQGNAHTERAQVTTRVWDEEDLDWWQNHFQWLENRNITAALSDIEIVSGGDYPREIVAGTTPTWTGEHGRVTLKATFNGLISGVPVVNKKLTVSFNATTLATGEYSNTTGAGGTSLIETAPTGLAELLYNALHPLQWTGSLTIPKDEPDFAILPGDVVNFTGTENAALTTARAQVREVKITLQTAVTEYDFGGPPSLSLNQLIDVLNTQRRLASGNSSQQRATGEPQATQSNSPALTPQVTASEEPGEQNHPFKVSHVSGDDFYIQGGSYEGKFIAPQVVDVGSTRPVSIFLQPTHSLEIYNEEYVHLATCVNDEGTPLAYVTSTSVHDDVDSVTLPGGGTTTTPKPRIATIGASDVISQRALGNIVADINDDGSLTATAAFTFLTNE